MITALMAFVAFSTELPTDTKLDFDHKSAIHPKLETRTKLQTALQTVRRLFGPISN